jgi:hypothetical protein
MNDFVSAEVYINCFEHSHADTVTLYYIYLIAREPSFSNAVSSSSTAFA